MPRHLLLSYQEQCPNLGAAPFALPTFGVPPYAPTFNPTKGAVPFKNTPLLSTFEKFELEFRAAHFAEPPRQRPTLKGSLWRSVLKFELSRFRGSTPEDPTVGAYLRGDTFKCKFYPNSGVVAFKDPPCVSTSKDPTQISHLHKSTLKFEVLDASKGGTLQRPAFPSNVGLNENQSCNSTQSSARTPSFIPTIKFELQFRGGITLRTHPPTCQPF